MQIVIPVQSLNFNEIYNEEFSKKDLNIHIILPSPIAAQHNTVCWK